MDKILLHCCCAPCSLSCIDPLRNDGVEPVAFWYNPNIHPWTEYKARRDCLLSFAPTIEMQTIVCEKYGLRDFVRHVSDDIDNRCIWCYTDRLETVAEYASTHGFSAFTTTLLASVYQKHDLISEIASSAGRHYGIKFLYRDFRPYFRDGNARARELGFYMQKYCGCVFSEEDRYKKQIECDRKEFKLT